MFDKLKSLFIVEDENAAKQNKQQETPKVQKPSVSSVLKKPTPTIPNSTKSTTGKKVKPSAKFIDVLLKAVDKNNLDGFDYLEYKQSLQSLSGLSMDEKTRYESAYAMAKTMGATPQKLISAANHYISVLNEEKVKFEQALNNRRSSEVTERNDRIKQLKESITRKEKEIKKLQAEIINDKKELDKFNAQINKSQEKLNETSAGFIAAYDSVKNQISTDIANMQKYLK